MKVLVMGSNGMAGHMVARYLSNKYSITTLARSEADLEVDVQDFTSVKYLLTQQPFDFIINCIGVLVEESKKRPDIAIRVNSHFPRFLEKMYLESDTRIIHISTDCVFSGERGGYAEDDIPDPKDIYGSSKAEGELDNHKDITLRTSIIGPEISDHKTGLFNWFLNAENPTGWDNALWNGITTLELAKVIEQYIENPLASGIHHPVVDDPISKYELLQLINEVYGLGKEIAVGYADNDIDKSLLDTKGFFTVSDYTTQLEELKEYEDLYSKE